MAYPTGSLERFAKGLLEDTIPESSETHGHLTLIQVAPSQTTTISPRSNAHDSDSMSMEFDVAEDNCETNNLDLYSCSGVSHTESSDSTRLYDPIDDDLSQETHGSEDRVYGARSSSIEETCSFQIMDLLDKMGAPRNGYDRLIALIRKQKKLGGFRVTKAVGRETLMKSLKKKFPSPGVLSQTLDNTKIFFFPFTQMLQDLLDTMQGDIHVINAPPPPNSNHFVHHEEIGDELWDTHRRHGQGAFFLHCLGYLILRIITITWCLVQ